MTDEHFQFLDSLSSGEDRLRGRGQFFTSMEEDVRDTRSVAISAQDFETIRRTAQQAKVYELCTEFIDDDSMTVGVGSRNGTTNTANSIARIDATGTMAVDRPHAEVCQKAFGFLTEAC